MTDALPPEVGIESYALPNGLSVVLQEDHRADTVALHLRYRVGSRDEGPGEHGCAHLFEHLMFEGSKNVGNNQFDALLTAAGGENNAWTSEDATAYHMTFPSGAADLALFLESDRMAYLLDGLRDEDIANQQGVVLQERAEGYAEVNGRDWDTLSYLAWSEGGYRVPVIGTEAEVRGFTADGVRAFWGEHYKPWNAVLVVVGNFKTPEMREKIGRWFGEVPGPPGPLGASAIVGSTPSLRGDGLIQDSGVQERTLYLSWPAVPLGDPDEAALDVLSYVLDDGRGTRLDDAVYFESRMSTDVWAGLNAMEAAGLFVVSVTAPSASLVRVEKTVHSVIADVIKNPPTEAELARAKKRLETAALEGLEYPADRAEVFADCFAQTGRADCTGARLAARKAVTSADLVRVARKYLDPARRVSLSVIPPGAGKAIPGAKFMDLP